MGVGAVGGVVGALVVDQGVLSDVGRDDEGWDADAETGEVVGHVVGVGDAVEGDSVLWCWDVDWWADVVGESSVLIEVLRKVRYGSIWVNKSHLR